MPLAGRRTYAPVSIGEILVNKKWLACVLAALMAPALAVAASDNESAADVRCIAVAFKMAQADNPQIKSAGQLLAIYYLGRLDGHTTQVDLEDLIVDQISKMDEATFRTEAARCGNALTEKGQQLTRIGQNLLKRAQQLQQSSAPSK
jgi:hypothetical protein